MFELLAAAEISHQARPAWMLMAVAVLALVGLGTVVFVMLRSRELKLRPVSALGTLLAALWLLPAAAATVYVVRQAVPHFDPAVADVPSYDELRTITVGNIRLHDEQIGLPDDGTRPASVRLGGPIELKSMPWPTPEEAVRDARRQALLVIDTAFRPAYPYEIAMGRDAQQLVEKAVAGQSVERTRHRTENASFHMHVARLTLDLSPAVRNAYADWWHTKIAQVRLVVLGGLTALAIVIVVAAAAYFRLDLTTHGAYRRRLKVAAVSLIVAGALALTQVYWFRAAEPRPGAADHDDRIAQIDSVSRV